LLTAMRPHLEGPQADFDIPALIGQNMGISGLAQISAAAVFAQLAAENTAFAGLSYQKLAEVHEQWPIVGRSELYYGGTTYENTQGLGVQLPLVDPGGVALSWPQVTDFKLPILGAVAFPISRLYDCGSTLRLSDMLDQRIGEAYILVSPAEAERLKVVDGGVVRLIFTETGQSVVVRAVADEQLPERVVLAPRSFGMPISKPAPVELKSAG